jgi:hypothetical protein
LVAAAAFVLLTGHWEPSEGGTPASAGALTVPTGTRITVRLVSALSSETAHAGDPWSGTVAGAVKVGNREMIPAGSTVRGVVTGAHPAGVGTRAMLDLAIQDVSSGGAPRSLTAGIDALQAALPEARPVPSNTVAPAPKGSPVRLVSGAELVFVVAERSASR